MCAVRPNHGSVRCEPDTRASSCGVGSVVSATVSNPSERSHTGSRPEITRRRSSNALLLSNIGETVARCDCGRMAPRNDDHIRCQTAPSWLLALAAHDTPATTNTRREAGSGAKALSHSSALASASGSDLKKALRSNHIRRCECLFPNL